MGYKLMQEIVSNLANYTLGLEDLQLRLVKSDITMNQSTQRLDLLNAEADFTGYAPITLNAGTAAQIGTNEAIRISYPQQVFTLGGGGAPQTIRGIWIERVAGLQEIVLLEKYGLPAQLLSPGDNLGITPKWYIGYLIDQGDPPDDPPTEPEIHCEEFDVDLGELVSTRDPIGTAGGGAFGVATYGTDPTQDTCRLEYQSPVPQAVRLETTLSWEPGTGVGTGNNMYLLLTDNTPTPITVWGSVAPNFEDGTFAIYMRRESPPSAVLKTQGIQYTGGTMTLKLWTDPVAGEVYFTVTYGLATYGPYSEPYTPMSPHASVIQQASTNPDSMAGVWHNFCIYDLTP